MSTEENKAVVRRWYEAFNPQNLAGVFEDCAPDFVFHGTGVWPDMDLAGAKQLTTAFLTAFPDAHYTLENLIAEGDKVVSRWTFHGTHQGAFMGIPPTGKQVRMTGIGIDRIEDDKFVESWSNADVLGLLQQLGAIPQMMQAGA
jgi:steroid delta-isomerase-like uncharacterized protein